MCTCEPTVMALMLDLLHLTPLAPRLPTMSVQTQLPSHLAQVHAGRPSTPTTHSQRAFLAALVEARRPFTVMPTFGFPSRQRPLQRSSTSFRSRAAERRPRCTSRFMTPAAGTCVYNNNSISTSTVEEITGLTAGQTYYIQMYDFGADDFGAFEFCMFSPGAPPANDECANATAVTLGTGSCGPTVNADNSFATGIPGSACGSTSTSYGDADIWFSFQATAPSAFLNLLSEPGGGTAASMYISVYDACGGTCVYNNNSISTSTVEEITGLTAGQTYYIQMYDFGANDFGAFEFCMFGPGAPPANDECANATAVTLGTGSCGPTVNADNSFATGVPGSACGNTSTSFGDGDIWFSFVAGGPTACTQSSVRARRRHSGLYVYLGVRRLRRGLCLQQQPNCCRNDRNYRWSHRWPDLLHYRCTSPATMSSVLSNSACLHLRHPLAMTSVPVL